MRFLKALVLGAVGVGALAYATATTVALAVAATGGELTLSVGPIGVVAVERLSGGDSATTLGPGLAAIAICGGLVNATAALVLGRRAR